MNIEIDWNWKLIKNKPIYLYIDFNKKENEDQIHLIFKNYSISILSKFKYLENWEIRIKK